MPQAIDLKPDTRFFGLFISRSGDGKTCAAASFPKPIHYIDFDLRMRGLLGAKHFLDLKDISYESFPPQNLPKIENDTQLTGIKETYIKVIDHLSITTDMIKRGQSPIKTLVLASITSMTKVFAMEALKLAPKGKYIGHKRIAGPPDYNYEQSCTFDIFELLRGCPCNIIIDGHIVDKYGKSEGQGEDKYAPSEIIGEKLSIRDNLGENLLVYFDEVYRFYRSNDGKKFSVRFRSDMAKTAYPQLPFGEVDISHKPFYQEWLKLVKEEKKK